MAVAKKSQSADAKDEAAPKGPVADFNKQQELDAYRAMRAGRGSGPELPEAPRLALVDLPNSPSIPEFRIICAAAAEVGLEAVHATTEELDYDGSVLRAGGEPVHLVYRRALVDDLTEGDLTAAYRDGVNVDLPQTDR